jgi:hypothetical protein
VPRRYPAGQSPLPRRGRSVKAEPVTGLNEPFEVDATDAVLSVPDAIAPLINRCRVVAEELARLLLGLLTN